MAVVLAAVSIAWFGWGQQGGELIAWLRWGMVIAAGVLVVAIVLMVRIPAAPTMASDPHARRVYWISVAVEVVLIVGGAVVLALTGNGIYLSTWTLFVVGVHFLPFVKPFGAPLLRVTAIACVVVAGLAVWAGIGGWASPPTVACGAGGTVLLLSAAMFLRSALRLRCQV